MKKNKIKLLIVSTFLLVFAGLPLKANALSPSFGAATATSTTTSSGSACDKGYTHPANSPDTCAPIKTAADCSSGKVDAKDKTKCVPLGDECLNKTDQQCLSNNPIIRDLNAIINVLSALVGVAVVGSLIYGGIQYSMAGENSQSVSAAKSRITRTLVAMVVYISIVAFLQWLIPGGILG